MSAFLLLLVKLNLAMGAAIILVSLLRRPLRAQFGAPIAYAIWFLVPIAGLASLFPPRVVALAPVASVPVPAAPLSVMVPIAHSALRVTEQLTGPGAFAAIAASAAHEMPDTALLLFAAWTLGTLAMTLYLTRLQLRFSAAVRLGQAGPAVLGFLRPRIVTPDGFQTRFTPQEQAAILAHERVHLARQDARINGLTALLRCLCWFNPLIHLGARWLRVDQELACDATAVTGQVSRSDYAKALLKSQLVVTALPLGCNWPGAQHPLIERIALLKRKPPGAARRLAGAGLVLLAATSAGLGAWAAQPPVAAKLAAAGPPAMVLATLPAPVVAPAQTAQEPVATANAAGSGNDVDASKTVHADGAVSAAPETLRTASIEARTVSATVAPPQIAPASKPIADPSAYPPSQVASSEPKDGLARNTAAAPATRESTAAAASGAHRPRTEAALECLLGIGPAACWKSADWRYDGPVERVTYLGANAAGDDIYEVQYMHTDSTYGIAPRPGPDGRTPWFKKRGNPNAIIPVSLVAIPSRSVPILIYTRSQNSPVGGCTFRQPSFPANEGLH